MVKTCPLILAVVLLGAAPALADQQPPATLMRVDQAVGDLDKTSVSLRKIEPGLHEPTQLSVLFVPVAKPGDSAANTSPLAGPAPYYRMGPGYRARVDRLNYLIVNTATHDAELNVTPAQDGHYFELIPANTVYELSPWFPTITTIDRQPPLTGRSHAAQPSAPQERAAAIDHRLPSTQVDNRVERRLETLQSDRRIGPKQ